MEKKASDFRYNTGETKVPWAAVGENYNAQDLMTIIRFMMKGKGEAYDEALKTVEKDVLALDKVSAPPAKLSLDVEVGKAENMCDEYLHTTGSTFLTNCTAGFEIACKYTGLKPGDEVIVPAITFAATMAYPLSIGCKLVFADVDPLTLNMDPKDVEKKIKVQDKNTSDYPYYAVVGVDGMKCKHCKLHVENAFNEKDGNWAEVNLEKKEADVRMKTKLTDREIRDIVSKAGYVLRNIEWKQA